ncbi:MAG: HNH endonuclease [Castellaniella sp.]|uniref:HNH endonuclease n=1 Tax=Castellaniella sp. TaxID=1955812 RepID=UPI003A8601BF
MHQKDSRQWDSAVRARARQKTRALATNDARWRALRERVLQDEPLCRQCTQAGRLRAASVVDHVNGNATDNSPSNLQPLCISCHAAKTAREDGGFGNPTRRPGR